jgi:exosortase C (VPDSG-CTERM-specific)
VSSLIAESRNELRTAWRGLPRSAQLRFGGLAGYVCLIVLIFMQPLIRLMSYSFQSHLNSHILLVPLIVGYLLVVQRRQLVQMHSSIGGAILVVVIGLAALGVRSWWWDTLSTNDELALVALAVVSLIVAGAFLFLGARWMLSAAFPMSFLVFAVPMPDGMVNWLELASVRASADVAASLFRVTATPLLREGNVFGLPGIVLEVARECSGIRSSWVLFLTSLLASHLVLDARWRRIAFVAFVIPLAIVRNGFRILVIGLLCVHVGPQMIDSPIHHQGGPLFFALSLGPLFLLLWWLRRREQ